MRKIIKIIFRSIFLTYATLLFNGEIYAHGINALFKLDLIFFYFVFTSLILLFITMTNRNLKATFLFGSTIGLVLEVFITKSIFEYPIFLGINWLSVLLQIMYWGMAAILPFYIYKLISKKKNFKKTYVNMAIVIYLLIEVFVGSLTAQPNTLMWIFSGIFLILFVIPKLKENDLII